LIALVATIELLQLRCLHEPPLRGSIVTPRLSFIGPYGVDP
jgi:hypothetical protein